MKNLTTWSELETTKMLNVLSNIPMASEQHLNKNIIELIKAQGAEYIDDFYDIESGTWCMYFTYKTDDMYQLCINLDNKSEEYGVKIFDSSINVIADMVSPISLETLLMDPDVGLHRLLYNS